MVKINFEVSDMTFAEALNAAIDVASHCRKVPVTFVFQGVRVELVCFHENVCAPKVPDLNSLTAWNDEYLTNEVVRRSLASQDFSLLLMRKIQNHFQ